MARKRSRTGRFTRKAYRRARTYTRSFRRRKSGREGITKMVLHGGAYGAIRGPVGNIVAPYAAKIPILGNYSLNAAMAVLDYLAYKKGSGIVRDIGKAGLYGESMLAGGKLSSGVLSGAMNGISTSATTPVWT